MLGPNPPFGFLNAYEPGKASFEKKKVTQETWAYGLSYLIEGKIERRGPDFYRVGFKWSYDPSKKYGTPGYNFKERVEELITTPPLIWDNTPLPGFKIVKSVSRWSTSNKFWRIMDPRKVEFEISTAVLEQLIEDATILKGGIIDAKCAWMSNKNLIVVP